MNNCFEQIESFQLTAQVIMNELKELDLTQLRNLLENSKYFDQIKSLLQSIEIIVPVGSYKYYPYTKDYHDQNLRWLFLGPNDKNIASEIYLILARSISDRIHEIFGSKFKLVCHGSVISGYSTFQISRSFPQIPYLHEDFIPAMTQSDIDLYIIPPVDWSYSYEEYSLVVDRIIKQMTFLRASLPNSLLFSIPSNLLLASFEILDNLKIPYVKL